MRGGQPFGDLNRNFAMLSGRCGFAQNWLVAHKGWWLPKIGAGDLHGSIPKLMKLCLMFSMDIDLVNGNLGAGMASEWLTNRYKQKQASDQKREREAQLHRIAEDGSDGAFGDFRPKSKMI